MIFNIRDKEFDVNEIIECLKNDYGQVRVSQSEVKELSVLLLSGINKRLYPYVERVIEGYNYIDSPIYNENGLDRETLAQLVDRVIQLAAQDYNEAEEALLYQDEEAYAGKWSYNELVRSLSEALIIHEIFGIRRPGFRQASDKYKPSKMKNNGMKYLDV